MPWNGLGLYTRLYNWVNDSIAGINIEATRMDEEDDNIATGLNNCLTKDGQNSPTNSLPMSGEKHTAVGEATARDEYTRVAELQDGKHLYGGEAGGDADDLTLEMTPLISAYVEGMAVFFMGGPDVSNDDATLNIDGVGTRDMKIDGANVLFGDIQPGVMYIAIYTGGAFEIISPYVFRQLVPAGASIEAETPTDDTTFPFNATTPCPMSVEIWDSAGYHDLVNPSRLTIPTGLGGLYQYSWRINLDPVGVFQAQVRGFVRKGGAGLNQDAVATYWDGFGQDFTLQGTGIIVLAAAEYLEVCITNTDSFLNAELKFQDSKAAQFSLIRLGDAP